MIKTLHKINPITNILGFVLKLLFSQQCALENEASKGIFRFQSTGEEKSQASRSAYSLTFRGLGHAREGLPDGPDPCSSGERELVISMHIPFMSATAVVSS